MPADRLIQNLHALLMQRIDRERLTTFARYLLRRFVDDRCFETAGALAYTTVFALVPFSAVAFAVLSAFPVFDQWTAKLTDFVFSNFVPEAARTVAEYLRSFADSTRQLSINGLLALIVSLLLTMAAIESTFNRIWRVPKPRPTLWRLIIFWTLLTLGTLLAVISLAISSYLFSLPILSGVETINLGERLLGWLPSVIALTVFTLAYRLIPNRAIRFKYAFIGGLLATILFDLAKWGFALYLRNASFQQLYGAIAVVPIFLVWVWLSWVVVLLGASIAASLSAFRYQPRAQRLPKGAEFYACLRLLGRLQAARGQGDALSTEAIHDAEPGLTDDLIQRLFAGLASLRIVQRNENGHWLLSRDLNAVTLGELHESLGLGVPQHRQPLPGSDDSFGRAAIAALEHIRTPLDQVLDTPVGRFVQADHLIEPRSM